MKQTLVGLLCMLPLLLLQAGCKVQHEVEVKPIKVEPIHITVDVNLRIDRQLDDFFDFEEAPKQ